VRDPLESVGQNLDEGAALLKILLSPGSSALPATWELRTNLARPFASGGLCECRRHMRSRRLPRSPNSLFATQFRRLLFKRLAAVLSTDVSGGWRPKILHLPVLHRPNPQFEKPGRLCGLVSAGELHVRFGVQGQ
jgi:hypothetical protein